MKKYHVIILLLATLSACAPQSSNYAKIPEAYNTQMATDTARQLVKIYPPASTHFVLAQATNDAFGIELQKDLRESGYAVQIGGSGPKDWFSGILSAPAASNKTDFHSDRIQKSAGTDADATYQAVPVVAVKTSTPGASAPVVMTANSSSSAPTVPLSYIVDALGDDLYRVTIRCGTQVMSHVYGISGNRLVSAGAWARKE